MSASKVKEDTLSGSKMGTIYYSKNYTAQIANNTTIHYVNSDNKKKFNNPWRPASSRRTPQRTRTRCPTNVVAAVIKMTRLQTCESGNPVDGMECWWAMGV